MSARTADLSAVVFVFSGQIVRIGLLIALGGNARIAFENFGEIVVIVYADHGADIIHGLVDGNQQMFCGFHSFFLNIIV